MKGRLSLKWPDDLIASDRHVVNAALVDLREQFAEGDVAGRRARLPGCWNSMTSATTSRPMMAHKARFLKFAFIAYPSRSVRAG